MIRRRSTLQTIRRDTLRKIRQVGLRRTLKHAAARLLGNGMRSAGTVKDQFDSKYGIETAQIVTVGALDIPDHKLEHSNRYETLVPEMFFSIFDQLQIDHQNFVFIDIGSGKGRALLLASFYPFKRIIGIELSSALTDLARCNINIFRDESQKCATIQALCQDGTKYKLPPDENIILYMYNPFDGEEMRAFIRNLEDSVIQSRFRTVHVVHVNPPPLGRSLWNACKHFRILTETKRYAIYTAAACRCVPFVFCSGF